MRNYELEPEGFTAGMENAESNDYRVYEFALSCEDLIDDNDDNDNDEDSESETAAKNKKSNDDDDSQRAIDEAIKETLRYYGDYDPACFDIKKAKELYAGNEASQLKAVSYAFLYAYKPNSKCPKEDTFKAKSFIVSIIKERGIKTKDDVTEHAKNAFFLFFRNYLRTVVAKYYKSRNLTDSETALRISEGLDELWAYVYSRLDAYDPDKAQLTTFYDKIQLRGQLTDNDEKRRHFAGNREAAELAAAVVKAKERFEQIHGREPDTMETREELLRTYNRQVIPTLGKIEQTMSYIKLEGGVQSDEVLSTTNDSGEKLSVYDTVSQNAYPEPERYAIDKELNDAIYAAISFLGEEERAIFLLKNGLYFKDGALVELPKGAWNLSKLESTFNKSASEIRRISEHARAKAGKHLAPLYGRRKRTDSVAQDEGILLLFDVDDDPWNEAIRDISDFTPD